jgi:hypothetical protein
VGLDGLIHGDFPFHPDVFSLDAFETTKHEDACVDLDLPREIQTFMLMILGSIIRGQRGERQQAIQTPNPGPYMSTLQTTRRCAKMSDCELIKEQLSTMQSSLFIAVFK